MHTWYLVDTATRHKSIRTLASALWRRDTLWFPKKLLLGVLLYLVYCYTTAVQHCRTWHYSRDINAAPELVGVLVYVRSSA